VPTAFFLKEKLCCRFKENLELIAAPARNRCEMNFSLSGGTTVTPFAVWSIQKLMTTSLDAPRASP
jgi:hypothetical protein